VELRALEKYLVIGTGDLVADRARQKDTAYHRTGINGSVRHRIYAIDEQLKVRGLARAELQPVPDQSEVARRDRAAGYA
jgi:nucleoid-associated protein YgaU